MFKSLFKYLYNNERKVRITLTKLNYVPIKTVGSSFFSA